MSKLVGFLTRFLSHRFGYRNVVSVDVNEFASPILAMNSFQATEKDLFAGTGSSSMIRRCLSLEHADGMAAKLLRGLTENVILPEARMGKRAIVFYSIMTR